MSVQPPKYSIIVPVYNCGVYLDACIESILGQTLDDFELLLVDDGSTDGSGQRCEEYKAQDKRVRVFHKENGGAASARNVGLDNAQGAWILFIDGDDTIESDTLEQVDAVIKEHPEVDLVTFGMAFDYYRNDIFLQTEYLSNQCKGPYQISELLNRFESHFQDNEFSSSCNKVFKRDYLKTLKYNESMCLFEDLDLVIRYLVTGVSAAFYLEEPLYHYRLDEADNHYLEKVAKNEVLQATCLGLAETSKMVIDRSSYSDEVARTIYDLCSQLVSLHLVLNGYDAERLETSLKWLHESETMRSLATSVAAQQEDCIVRILAGNWSALALDYRKRHNKYFVKQKVKSILKTVGLR